MSILEKPESTFNEFWGCWPWPEPTRRREFDPAGMLDDDYSCFAIERLDTGECVGFEEYGRITLNKPNTWLGTIIAREHQGLGFGREAKLLNLCYLFENYPLTMVWADTTDEHVRARAGLEAVGMRLAGRHNGYLYKRGELWPSPCYQIMREEWEEMTVRRTVIRG
jgi:RimJ/RimL family protein N-acetyltransferase